jgi:hypothetical protein
MNRASIFLILLMNLIDVFLTIRYIKYGRLLEANPVMGKFLEFGVLPFIIAKSTLVFGGCYLLWKYRDRWLVRYGIYISLVSYFTVLTIFYHMI